ncbi:MAG: 50S ribosomal protein L16 3-hydroxylase [Gammaproteobacteria bacterium]|jgi:50S ribosomal protein L16 3-hydroxylase
MSILGTFSATQFIDQHWQKEPLLIRQALTLPTPIIDPDELAGLACEDDVESRLVQCDAQQAHWQCEDGPFDETRFATLASSHWTLLVQGVDQHEPVIHALLDHFAFLPRWRVDDIMISYAVDGGGVGAHYDHYDVFLLQLQGKRQWQIGQRCDDTTPLRDDTPLKLLCEFHPREEYVLEAGDMLYLPPRLAHCGTALGDGCVTASIGYRSPSPRAVAERALEMIAATLSTNPGYRDTAPAIDADPFRINPAAMSVARAMGDAISPAQLAEATARAFGTQVTESRHADLIHCDEPLDAATLDAHIRTLIQEDEPLVLEHHRASRFAYANGDGDCVLFVDGEAHCATLAMARGICHGHVAADHLRTAIAPGADHELLLRLINQGSLIPS